jgi:plasmid stabilization system protein ParE
MEKGYEVVFTIKAKSDLKEIFDYYAIVAGEDKAQSIVNQIILKVSILKLNPFIGMKEFLLSHLKKDYRRLVKGNYKIIYLPHKNRVTVYRVYDSRRSPKDLKIR